MRLFEQLDFSLVMRALHQQVALELHNTIFLCSLQCAGQCLKHIVGSIEERSKCDGILP